MNIDKEKIKHAVAKVVVHNNTARISLKFPYVQEVVNEIKKVTDARWSRTLKSWHVPDTAENRQLFNLPDAVQTTRELVETRSDLARLAPLLYTSEVNRHAQAQLVAMIRLKGYSSNTLKTYKSEFGQLLYVLGNFPVHQLTEAQIKSYLLYCLQRLGLHESQLNQRINAIKFYFEMVLKKERMLFDLPRPKKQLLLPHVLDTTDVKQIIEVTENLKHKALLMLAYGGGLRVSEVVSLKIRDIDSKRMQIRIEAAKGKKDRLVMLSEKLLVTLRSYFKAYKPSHFLFEGQHGEKHYSTRSAQAVFKQALVKAKVNKKVGVHSLRHSFATHLLETGTDIRVIQELLGHDHIATTQRYTQVSKRTINKVESPLDKL